MLLVGVLLGLLLGAVVGWLAARLRQAETLPLPAAEDPEIAAARHRAELAAVRQEEAEARSVLQADVAHAEATVAGLRETVASLQQRLVDARADHQSLLEAHRRE